MDLVQERLQVISGIAVLVQKRSWSVSLTNGNAPLASLFRELPIKPPIKSDQWVRPDPRECQRIQGPKEGVSSLRIPARAWKEFQLLLLLLIIIIVIIVINIIISIININCNTSE